ncbi:MAG: nucleotide sugar dehydrogenase [Woeseiaceae bacterium]
MNNQKVSVSVFGLGYVGSVTAGCLSRNGHKVIGVDVTEDKLQSIRDGRAPLGEAGLDQIIGEAVKSGKLTVTNDTARAVAESELSIICVGTPNLDSGALTTGQLERVCEQIGTALKSGDRDHVVCVRSTMLPGTLRTIVVPTLEKASGLKSGEDFHVAVNPEFLREGTAISDFDNPPKIVIGTDSDFAAKQVGKLTAGIDAPVFHIPADVAELVKCVDNAWHATKITFGNEVGELCRIAGVDSHELIDVFLADTQLNISPVYLRPGFAFGGSCLPKDVRALNYFARHADSNLHLLAQVVPSNTDQIERTAQRILSFGKRRIGLYGLSFKAGTDDLRESPFVRLAEILIGKGCELAIFDPNIDPTQFVGANRAYMEEHLPHLGKLLVSDAEALTSAADLVVIGHKTALSESYAKSLPDSVPVFDLVRLPAMIGRANYHGLYW